MSCARVSISRARFYAPETLKNESQVEGDPNCPGRCFRENVARYLPQQTAFYDELDYRTGR